MDMSSFKFKVAVAAWNRLTIIRWLELLSVDRREVTSCCHSVTSSLSRLYDHPDQPHFLQHGYYTLTDALWSLLSQIVHCRSQTAFGILKYVSYL